jgi:hypothetical protein
MFRKASRIESSKLELMKDDETAQAKIHAPEEVC